MALPCSFAFFLEIIEVGESLKWERTSRENAPLQYIELSHVSWHDRENSVNVGRLEFWVHPSTIECFLGLRATWFNAHIWSELIPMKKKLVKKEVQMSDGFSKPYWPVYLEIIVSHLYETGSSTNIKGKFPFLNVIIATKNLNNVLNKFSNWSFCFVEAGLYTHYPNCSLYMN